MTNPLFQPLRVARWLLRSRVAMAPMTRGFADDGTGAVGPEVVEYYRTRAADGIGLILTEGITPSLRGKGTFGVPGLYTTEQTRAWEKVTDAVHREGGTIVAQLWHVGRLTHRELTGGLPPQAPSPIRANGLVHRLRKPYDMPVAMSPEEISEVIEEYTKAARNAVAAGFDGVEIHAAHGYLIDQFNAEMTNVRTDRYGGDLRGRMTFMKEVLAAVANAIGADRTIVRFSEIKDDVPEYKWDDPESAVKAYTSAFKEIGLSIVHPSTNRFAEVLAGGLTLHQWVRKYWDGVIIGVGGLDPDSASQAIADGIIDVAAFGRPLLANPDFVRRVKEGAALQTYEPAKHLAKLV